MVSESIEGTRLGFGAISRERKKREKGKKKKEQNWTQAAKVQLFSRRLVKRRKRQMDGVPGSSSQPINVRQDNHDRAAAGGHVAGFGAPILEQNGQNSTCRLEDLPAVLQAQIDKPHSR
jgi:hypothetical protein